METKSINRFAASAQQTAPRSNARKKMSSSVIPPLALLNSHQIEGDGLNILLYHHLWKQKTHFQPCSVSFPDTVVYEHNFPRGWYGWDFKNNEISRHSKKELDTAHIWKAFSETTDICVDIVAQYIFTVEDDNTRQSVASVEFFTKEDLFYFLHSRKERPDGILQKFILPHGKENHQIQVIWSPKVALVQRRSNKHCIRDKSLSTYHRGVTFDGPSHLSNEGTCANFTKEKVEGLCAKIVDHFTTTEHKTISRMVLYFKVDDHDHIWLLYCNSLRICPPKAQLGTRQRVPLNLSPLFVTPESTNDDVRSMVNNASSNGGVTKILRETDSIHVGLSNDQYLVHLIKHDVSRPGFPRIGIYRGRQTAVHTVSDERINSSLKELVSPSSSFMSSCSLPLNISCSTNAKLPSSRPSSPLNSQASPLNCVSAADSFACSVIQLGQQQQQQIISSSLGGSQREDKIASAALERNKDLATMILDDLMYGMYCHFMHDANSPYYSHNLPLQLLSVLDESELESFLCILNFSVARMPDGTDGYVCRKMIKPIMHLTHEVRSQLDLIFSEKRNFRSRKLSDSINTIVATSTEIV